MIAGIGNVIRIEACWLAEVSPFRRIADLAPEQALKIVAPSRWVMEETVCSGHRPKQIYGGRRRRCELPALIDGYRVGVEPEEPEGTLELLRRVPLFAELSDPELQRITDAVVPRSYPKGTRVFLEGDTSDTCYIIRSGELKVTREHPDGRAIVLATLPAGEVVGELAMLDGEARSASVEAGVDAQLLALSANEMRAILRDHAEITVKLIQALTRRLREANERISSQSFQTVPSRVAGVIAQLVAETDAESPKSPTIRMTQADLAQLAGTSRESVSRFLATLERAGVVRVGRGRVTVLEPERLDAYIF